jgi:ribosome-associated heat shock protein Hsp15
MARTTPPPRIRNRSNASSQIDCSPEADCGIEAMRVDHWLWAVRLFKTRSTATAACKGGHVRINGRAAKPASPIRVGDRVEARVADRDRVIEVVRLIEKRVAAPIAAECVVDHSPPAPAREYVAPLFRRDPGAGRPTKKDRRRMEQFRNR